MKLIGRYLKKHLAAVLAVVALLFGQAICELLLPNMMSDIVNTGIQQGGIAQGVPEVISKDGKRLVEATIRQNSLPRQLTEKPTFCRNGPTAPTQRITTPSMPFT